MSNLPTRPLIGLGIAGLVFSASMLSQPAMANGDPMPDGVAPSVAAAPDELQTFIIGFSEAPVATFQGNVRGAGPIPRRGEGRGRVDVNSAQAKAHARALENRQRQAERAMGRAMGREIQVSHRMQHVFNGVVAELTAEEAQFIAGMEDVLLVEPYKEYLLETDVGPLLIEADGVWFGDALPPGLISGPGRRAQPGGYQGEGVVFGIVDSGVNWGSPSFSETDMDGFVHSNPLGDGEFLGTCTEGGVDEGRCNAKLIGAYDFICTLTPICENPSLLEIPGGSDENGHGTHVASTAAGNRRMATFRGNEIEISGVAPRANLVIYDACYTNAAGQGLCPNVSTLASINQAIADGVDVINYSISGGTNPWGDAISLAFLAATDAGIFVSASAGNAGPGPSTLGHLQPWVATVAAAQHGRGGFDFALEIDGPVAPPAQIERIFLTPGVNGVPFENAVPAGTPVVVSPGIDTAADGCAPFSDAELFSGSIAVIRRGSCAFSTKVNNAAAAGAVATIIANNTSGVLSPFVPGTTIPAFLISQADADALRDFAAANPGVTGGIPTVAFITSNTPDQLAAFSSRGPSRFDVLKPDVTGPGVLVLAADAGGPSLEGLEDLVGLKSGTSMSSPHNAGAGGLLRQVWPDWTPAEAKSALMLTAEQTVLLEDGETAATPLAAGAGRINVRRAVQSGLVLDESLGNYLAANPATGGDPTALNLASYSNRNCIGSCSFERTFRATRANSRNWDVRLEGLEGSVNRPRFNLGGSRVGTLSVTIDTTAIPSDGEFRFGALVLTPRGNNDSPELRLPIAVSVPPPTIAFADPVLDITVEAGASASGQTEVINIGGPTLSYLVDNDGVAVRVLADNAPALNTGTRAGFITNFGVGLYASDDLSLQSDTRLTSLQAQGFTQGLPVGQGASAITWSIFPDGGGFPAGNPETSPGAAVWSFTSAPNGPGVSTNAASTITLNLDAAGQDAVVLPPGTWWLTVHSTTATVAENWIWRYAGSGTGNSPHTIFPASGGPVWSANLNFPGLAYRAEGEVPCGASWIVDVSPAFGDLGGNASASLSVTVDATDLAAGSYSAFVCVSSNDPAQPQATLGVELTVTP